MKRAIFRSLTNVRSFDASPRALSIMERVGRAMGLGSGQRAFEHLDGMETLEDRVMLEGSFATAINVTLTNNKGASASAAINPAQSATDNDYYQFTPTTTGFFSILADTANEATASNLNTRVTVYGSANLADVVASGTNNGTLTSGLQRDGWAGLIAQAGHTYFVVVSSDYSGTLPNLTTGNTYTLSINGNNVPFDIANDTGIAREFGSPAPNPPLVPITPILGEITQRQQDIIYKYAVPSDTVFDSLVTINAQTTQANLTTRLNTRIEVYSSAGALVASDSDAGRLQDAFTTIRAHPGDTFYIRIRSDKVRTSDPIPGIQGAALGSYYLVLDGIGEVAALNPVRRLFSTQGAFDGFGDPTTPANPPVPAPVFQTGLWQFKPQGDGLAIITVQPTGLAPVTDPAIRLFDSNGVQLAYNDNFAGLSAELQVRLIANRTYYLVVDGFEVNSQVQYTLDIEANHTFDPTQPIDDHVNTPTGTLTFDQARRVFEQATGLTFGQAAPLLDANQNIVRDRGLRTTATGTGRLYNTGDTDLFSFTAPVDMLSDYTGNNDDAGTSLFIGGRFSIEDPANPWPATSRNVTAWDAADYWYTGRQFADPNLGITWGFNDNPNTPGTNGPEVYAMYDWDPGTPQNVPTGMTRRILAVGGDFDLIVPDAFGQPQHFLNLAFWVQDWNTGNFGWATLGDADGPVHAITTFLPDATEDNPNYNPADPTSQQQVNIQQVLVNNQPSPYLVVGGQFATVGGVGAANIATFDLINGWQAIGTGTNGPVFSMTVYDPQDPGDERAYQAANPPAPEKRYVANTPDIPNSLIFGGQFTQANGTAVGNIALWTGATLNGNADVRPLASGRVNAIAGDPGSTPAVPPFGGTLPTAFNTNGPVFALTVFDFNAVDFDGPNAPLLPADSGNTGGFLVIGGSFTTAGGAAANNLAIWGLKRNGQFNAATPGNYDPTQDQNNPANPGDPQYAPQLFGRALSVGGAGDSVLALTVWDPPDINGNTINPLLVIGGSFTHLGQQNLIAHNGAGFVALFGGAGTNGTVRAVAAVDDAQEPGIEANLDSGNPQQVLYIGGDFTQIDNGNPAPLLANHVAQFSAFTGPNNPDDFFDWTALNGGVDNADPNAPTPASVFALSSFDDGNPLEWDRHDRKASRLAITVSPDSGSFANMRVRVFDSNFNIVYGFAKPGSETISPIFPDPAGMIDPSLSPGSDSTLDGIKLWGGETYYVEVSNMNGNSDTNATPRGGTGRYTLTVTVDAIPTDLNGDGTLDDVNAQIVDEPNEGSFANAYRITTTLNNGEGTNYKNSAATPPPLNFNMERVQHVAPAANAQIIHAQDLGNISSVDDTDLYVFRAEFTGYAEIRLATFGLADEFGELIGNAWTPSTNTYNSYLDAALRIFRNDFTQIAYNDDNPAFSGDRTGYNVGTLQGFTFFARDPRVVIPVVAGNDYFIQVESGQMFRDGSPLLAADREVVVDRERDIRKATGSYQVLVNQMPQLDTDIKNGVEVQDDHTDGPDGTFNLATPIPIGDAFSGSLNGKGSVTGIINNTPLKPADRDLFTWIAPGTGTMVVRVTPINGSNLIPDITLVTVGLGTQTGTPEGNNVFSIQTDARKGQVFGLIVAGSGGSEGAYRIDITSLPGDPGIADADDYASLFKWSNAQEITLQDYLGRGTISGKIEAPGDTDVFKFRTDSYLTMTLSVTSRDATLNPIVTVYEVSEDPNGNPMFLRVGVNDDISVTNTNSRVMFSIAPNRIKDVPDPGVDRVYPYYYIVVGGSDPNSDFGSYDVLMTFTPTDDYADGDVNRDGNFADSQFADAAQIVLDNSTGHASKTGINELATDSDIFYFDALAGGTATISVTTPSSSTLNPSLTIIDGQGNILASVAGTDAAGGQTISLNLTVTRSTRYYIVVQGTTPNVNTTLTGAYTLDVTAPPIDDYPNSDEFSLSDLTAFIPLSAQTGGGQLGGAVAGDPSNARISPTNDTDLFNFVSLAAGSYSVTINPYGLPTGLAPTVQIFDANHNSIVGPTTASAGLQSVTVTFSATAAGQRFYILVSAGAVAGADPTGEYAVLVSGPIPGGGGTGNDPSTINFNTPTTISLDPRTGDGSASDVIEVSGDRDLFAFTPAASGRVYVQVTTPSGSLLNASLRVLNAANENASSEVLFNADGIPGATANGSFDAVAGTRYYIVVDGLGDSTGSYTVKVNTRPVVNYLYYPEGFTNNNVREFISIVNTNNVAVNYTVYLRYEYGTQLETVVGSQTIAANSRGGLTLRDGPFYSTPGVQDNVPYAIVIESDAPLGATLAHYDFGTSLGDSFTENVSPTWNFARVERSPGDVLDFLVYYNPNAFNVDVTLTAYQTDGTPVSVTRTVQAGRRGGLSINDLPELPRGVFSVVLTSKATDSANQSAFIGIVASISHYNLRGDYAIGALGDPQGGATSGVITNFTQGPKVSSEVVLFNPGDTPATVTLIGTYIRATLPQLARTFVIPAHAQVTYTGTSLGLVADQPVGLTWSSSRPINALSFEIQNGDADGTQPATDAAQGYFFGDAFINPSLAGKSYFETLYFYNPTSLTNTINIQLVFFDQTTASFTVTVNAKGFAEVKLHERPEILNRSGPSWFGVNTSSALPFDATMVHYDLALGGGWATSGVPVGIVDSLARIG